MKLSQLDCGRLVVDIEALNYVIVFDISYFFLYFFF